MKSEVHHPERRQEPLATETGDREDARRVLDHLIGERLLTIRSNPDNLAEVQVDIAHEVLIDRWERLATWLTEDPEGRALREEFQRDAEKWDQGLPGTPARSRNNLPGADAAKRYLAWIDRSKISLSDTQRAFAEELRDMLRRRRWVRGAITGTIVVLLGMSIIFLFQAQQRKLQVMEEQSKTKIAEVKQQEAEKSAKKEKRIGDAQPLISKAAVAIGDNFQQGAALYRAEALVLWDAPEFRVQWMEALQRSLVPIETSSRRLLVGSLVYSPDGNYLIS
jgi:hypothetical protein